MIKRSRFFKVIVLALISVLAFNVGTSIAYKDLTSEKELSLSYFRYLDENYSNGYALNTVGNEGESHKPIFQIMSSDSATNYYCLNATVGESWINGTIGTNSTYNREYDLSSVDEINLLKNETKNSYKGIANSEYLNQILWILENMYVPETKTTPEETKAYNLEKKQELLSAAGLKFRNVVKTDVNGDPVTTDDKTYVYEPSTDYNYKNSDKLVYKTDYWYTDSQGNHQYVELSDDIVEVTQQAAIWYFTNYLDNNDGNSSTFNVREQGLQLACSNGTTETDSQNWKSLKNGIFDVETDVEGHKAQVGWMKQDQATILCWYLIDAANKYAEGIQNGTISEIGNPLKIEPEITSVVEKTISNVEYYVVGPIKISEQRTAVYSLNNTITVNNSSTTNSYISNVEGNRQTNQNILDYIGQDFYVTVPKSEITGDNITINFDGNYKTNDKNLLINTEIEEQPIVEVIPTEEELKLTVTAPIIKEFDLALRKRIIKLTNASGKVKDILNENSNDATRSSTYIARDIINNKTATYKHRKDPVVVEKGDIVTYSITIYNEGEMNGYATTIVDKLPQGLKLKGNTTGTYEKGTIKYSYVYNSETNEITFTNVNKNVLTAYNNGDNLVSETIEVECEVTQTPSTTTNTYLTNIAYITEEHNSEKGEDITTQERADRDSIPLTYPNNIEQNTKGDTYTGYNGKDNQSVYNDTNNGYYYKGQEDDDDFEIIVLKPVEFDLALQKYISEVVSSEGTTLSQGRQAPKINTSNLNKIVDNKKVTTATYTQDKTPISVKQGDFVKYTFTVYNEGNADGYVNKITDNIPKGLQFVFVKAGNEEEKIVTVWNYDGTDEDIVVSEAVYNAVNENNAYWQIDQENGAVKKDSYNGENTISVTCNVESYLGEKHKLKAYDSSKDNNYNGDGLDRVSVTLMLRVAAENKKTNPIRNEAAITEAEDEEGIKQDINTLRDRDSQINQWPGKDDHTKYQDDEDYDNIILKEYDLALTKFIVAISDDTKFEDGEYLTKDKTAKDAGSNENPYTRQTEVNTQPLKDGEKDAEYKQNKDSLVIPEGSYVLYNIRVYNEGEIDLYAGEVTDYLPNYLSFVDSDFNRTFGWNVEEDGKTVRTNYLSSTNGTDKMLVAFDKDNDNGKGSKLDYKDLQILCRVNSDAPDKTELVNSAEITKYENEKGENLEKDRDSEPDNLEEKNVKGTREQDDDDYDFVLIKRKNIDIALSKFIAAISDDTSISDGEYLTANGKIGSKENPYNRATKVDTKDLRDNPECHDATYTKVKDPLVVPAKSYVLYDIRVYNEGDTDIYAGEVTDYLPEYLDYVVCEFNDNYGWQVGADGKTIKTTYLSFNNGEKNLLKAFDRKTDNGEGSGLDYRDLQILCKVNDKAPSNTNIVNVAEITKYEDKKGDEIEEDVDSTPDNVNNKHEDDDDYETVLIKTFDLSLLKWVSTVYVTEDGKTETIQTGNTGDDNTDIIPKVEINRKKINSTVVKFGYTIKITNEGDIEGYAKEITDYVPEGLKFYEEDNNGWEESSEGVITTRLLENTLLKPGDSAEVTVIFRWINGSNNLGLKTNIAEISEDYNVDGVPDRDSTPGNKVWGEDDIDDAAVLLSISTGLVENIIMYVAGATVILMILAGGIIAIKKFVL